MTENRQPPYFTGNKGSRGGPEWLAPTAEYRGPMEVAPELHALTEGGGRYTSSINPQVEVNPHPGHYVSMQQEHPDTISRHPDYNIKSFLVQYHHEGDSPALEDTHSLHLGDNYPVTHAKRVYSGDDPREAQRAAVDSVMRIHQHVFHDRRQEGRRG